jgi:hypothetical protein
MTASTTRPRWLVALSWYGQFQKSPAMNFLSGLHFRRQGLPKLRMFQPLLVDLDLAPRFSELDVFLSRFRQIATAFFEKSREGLDVKQFVEHFTPGDARLSNMAGCSP